MAYDRSRDLLPLRPEAQRDGEEAGKLTVREYGSSGPLVIVLHGGPGAPGDVAPLARALSTRFRVLEPYQRPSGVVPLSVATHVEDLRRLIESRCEGVRPAIVGHSWGAMLALAFAAAHPSLAGPLVLVGCGTFDPAARARLQQKVESRMSAEWRARFEQLPQTIKDPDQLLRAQGDLLLPLYSYDAEPGGDEDCPPCDAKAHRETWADMLRLQETGLYPAAFAAIRSPVLMLHGAADPHPGRMILESLRPSSPQIEYREWQECGHYPWLEKSVRQEFVRTLLEWLSAELKH